MVKGFEMTALEDSLIVLFATAALSGFLVPFILNKVQVRSQQRQKQFEADLARQATVIQEQVALIERLSTALWEFQLTLIAPLYYGQFFNKPASELEAYQEAAKKYLSGAGGILGSIRAEIGKAVRLVPREQWLKLRNLYYRELLELDLKVTPLILSGPTKTNLVEWSQTQGYAVRQLAEIVDATVDELAEALKLKYLGDVGPEGNCPRTRVLCHSREHRRQRLGATPT
jgi:hypothetical protein